MYNGRGIPIEEKIQIFERFHQTGKELVGKTIFEGHPIGSWAIQIRNHLKNQSNDKKRINISEAQLNRLASLGILERKIDSTIDEKIDALIAWIAKYPNLKPSQSVSEEVLFQCSKGAAEYKQLSEEYKKMQKYYSYVTTRKSQGKLSHEQTAKCKEGNIGPIFGYPTKIEELARQYGRSEKDIDYIISKYGTMDNFYNLFRQNQLNTTSNESTAYDTVLARSIIKTVLDIDFDPNSSRYDALYRFIVNKKENDTSLSLYSSSLLRDALQILDERERSIIEKLFPLTEGNSPKSPNALEKEYGISSTRIRQIIEKARRKILRKISLRNSSNFSYSLDNLISNELLTDDEKTELSELQKNLDSILLSSVQEPGSNPDVTKGCAFLKSIGETIKERELKAKENAKEDAKKRCRKSFTM